MDLQPACWHCKWYEYGGREGMCVSPDVPPIYVDPLMYCEERYTSREETHDEDPGPAADQ